ncbi:MAG: hypothetical protein AUK24_08915 [Syntrophaceae bacterium CG2_30_49_12]|nr:MAG: hypothetical protein AUK24_08915 [Syntrophaceae bacterium CG2_30_49_12]PIP06761.1 MAG: hypothetical protein COX52_06155 [Syntrophobacterales bacterium CG23_combo_of_CG06-09_8_20_14_all_48_27]PJC72692.1 MAG: hypothetical protein CO012_11540 [Syntrophobacterales bacterium CG_4_8_14_3_um_filter_49_14]
MAKRFFDIVATTIGLILLCPVLFLLAWRIKAEDGGLRPEEAIKPNVSSRAAQSFRQMASL